jgi:hypothetical protein
LNSSVRKAQGKPINGDKVDQWGENRAKEKKRKAPRTMVLRGESVRESTRERDKPSPRFDHADKP